MSSLNTSKIPSGKPLPQGVHAPHSVLAADPISIADINLVSTLRIVQLQTLLFPASRGSLVCDS